MATKQTQTTTETPTEGWKWLINATKWHYFREGRSLCNRWLTFGTGFEQGNDSSPDNCKACMRKLEQERHRAGHTS